MNLDLHKNETFILIFKIENLLKKRDYRNCKAKLDFKNHNYCNGFHQRRISMLNGIVLELD